MSRGHSSGLTPKDVRYLALEGGGGKGVTYLGAIRALQNTTVRERGRDIPLLPIRLDEPLQTRRIKGISGTSAGAITALFLAMGATADQVGGVLSKPETFEAFFDVPAPGTWRTVDANNRPTTHSGLEPWQTAIYAAIKSGWIAALSLVKTQGAAMGWGGAALLTRLMPALLNVRGVSDNALLKRLLSSTSESVYGLLMDGGIFPGLPVRKFLQDSVNEWLLDRVQALENHTLPHPNISFAQFWRATQVDLRIIGVNLTHNRPAVFSAWHTPDFPVAEAVAISMNLPLVFKPVEVKAKVPKRASQGRYDYQGLWMDGGALNNLPIHVFDNPDESPDELSHAYDNPNPDLLHPGVLGLRLTDGAPGTQPRGPVQMDGSERHLWNLLGELLETLLYPSEEGQIRSPAERAQTVELFTYALTTLDFAPADELRKQPIAEAEKSIRKYFESRG